MNQDAYFSALSTALHAAHVARPTLVIDKQRLDANIDHLLEIINRGFAYRIVAKSLPSVPMLDYLMRRTGSNRLMCFHLPFMMQLVEQFPAADILLGKPMPVAGAQRFYDWYQSRAEFLCFDPDIQLQWLIDSRQRLQQYEDMARRSNTRLRVSLEIDVGLHRGGFQCDQEFSRAIEHIERSEFLQLAGLMGYEAHISKIPAWLGGSNKAYAQVQQQYQAFCHVITEQLGPDALDDLCLNTGGSTTYPLYGEAGPQNEISIASALVKPTDFDVDTLEHHQAAAFIATPVLKRITDPDIPMAAGLSGWLRRFGLIKRQACFIYGGNWLASPCYPANAKRSAVLGHSSNQEMYELPDDCLPDVDDFFFLRPSQSEAVFLQFGELAIYHQGSITDWWPVLDYPKAEHTDPHTPLFAQRPAMIEKG
ncbi:type III pyridoxal 5-phosphate-dependent enzyme [Bacterioplanes sanyensis]|uniref:Type III pyridoxal 5-phosphate-dependent enzyme n=1 Tax=Bacterioplanes sanyensis TaxID=1249553 RepID=A0A222FNS1_9GAMM|nr:alanine racemase [Bacterioplanes sanyensis]ASP40440.1 type III pyridoxal 5-phosphate-dependent enzyme [Bacterioplanes sanyensis]